MKLLDGLMAILVSVFVLAPAAAFAELERLGKVSVFGGAEKEEGAPAGGRAVVEAAGVLPLSPVFGLQGIGHFVGGRQARYGLSGGPIFSWNGGKAGVFVNYQHRELRENNFVFFRPSIALYFDQANLDLWYSQPVSSPQRSGTSVEYGINQLQGTFNLFPAADLNRYMRKDNLELTVGLQANTFAGAGSGKLNGAGIGPVVGLAFMPAQNLVVNLFRVTGDSRDRYRVDSGIQFFFAKGASTLKELRRRSLEPNRDAPGNIGAIVRPAAPSPQTPPPDTCEPYCEILDTLD
jgi:hypothetical protein